MLTKIIQQDYQFNDQMLASLSPQQDRFIPHRQHQSNCHPDALFYTQISTPDSQYSNLIKKQLFSNQNQRVINFNDNYTPDYGFTNEPPAPYFKQLNNKVDSPVKILDIPKFKDDFYLNNIDWCERGPLAIALDNQTYIYTPQNLMEVGKATFGSYVSGLKIQDCIMAVGLSNGVIEIYDLQRNYLVRSMENHGSRVGAFSFVGGFLVSGSKDRSILVHDLRIFNNKIRQFKSHSGQVCSLKSKNKNEGVFASGSNDGSAMIWDLNYGKISQLKGHKGAVKALDWCPWKNGVLATGAGNSTQKYVKIWDTSDSKLMACQPVQSQISSLVWNSQLRMLTTSHGYPHNSINFWTIRFDHNSCRLSRQKSFKAHEGRILSLAQSHDGNYLCSVGGDENMKFWCLREGESNPFRRQLGSNQQQFIRV